jgi:hypothetical protein
VVHYQNVYRAFPRFQAQAQLRLVCVKISRLDTVNTVSAVDVDVQIIVKLSCQPGLIHHRLIRL